MSELWNGCRAVLRTKLADDEWDRYVRPLHAWIEDDVVYLWPERGRGADRPPPPRVRALIDGTIRQARGRTAIRVEHCSRSPRHDGLVIERREKEHRAQVQSRARRELAEHLEACKRECTRLLEDPARLPRLDGTADQRFRQLLEIVEAAARRALTTGDSQRSWNRAPAPRDPPPWQPSGEAREAEADPPADLRHPRPVVASPEARAPGSRGDREAAYVGHEELQRARERMPWLTD